LKKAQTIDKSIVKGAGGVVETGSAPAAAASSGGGGGGGGGMASQLNSMLGGGGGAPKVCRNIYPIPKSILGRRIR
jgi:hypothetical protein